MSNLLIYNDSGEILRIIVAPNETLQEQILENEFGLIVEELPIEAVYIDTETQKVITFPEKPSPFYNFNWVTKRWDYSEELYQQHLTTLDNAAKQKRTQLLLNSDWTELPSALTRLGEAKVTQWQIYRQVLRDITTQSGYPENIVWPEQPN